MVKQCDLGRPICGQCIKAKRHCAGYERETTFMNRTIHSWEQRAAPRRAAPSRPIFIKSGWTRAAADQAFPKPSSNAAQSKIVGKARGPVLVRSVGASFVYRERFLGMFMQDYLPVAEQPSPVGLGSSFSWLQPATCLSNRGEKHWTTRCPRWPSPGSVAS